MTNLNKVHGVRTLAIPQGEPCSEHRGLLVLSSVPPGTATRSKPPYLHSTDQSKQSSVGKDSGNSPGRPLLRTKKGSCSEQGPNPKGYANETPLLLFKCLIYITIGGFRHRQVPREFPAQIRPSVFRMQPPPGKIPPNRPDILIQHTDLHKSAPFSSPKGILFFPDANRDPISFPPLECARLLYPQTSFGIVGCIF